VGTVPGKYDITESGILCRREPGLIVLISLHSTTPDLREILRPLLFSSLFSSSALLLLLLFSSLLFSRAEAEDRHRGEAEEKRTEEKEQS